MVKAILLSMLFFGFQQTGEERETVVFELTPEKISEIQVVEDEWGVYWVSISLKDEYHADFAYLTGTNVENYLKIKYEDKILSRPVIKSRIMGGRLSAGPYDTREEAREVAEMIE